MWAAALALLTASSVLALAAGADDSAIGALQTLPEASASRLCAKTFGSKCHLECEKPLGCTTCAQSWKRHTLTTVCLWCSPGRFLAADRQSCPPCAAGYYSPGGTAGGLRTTTIAVGLGHLWNQLRGGTRGMVIFHRTIPAATGSRSSLTMMRSRSSSPAINGGGRSNIPIRYRRARSPPPMKSIFPLGGRC